MRCQIDDLCAASSHDPMPPPVPAASRATMPPCALAPAPALAPEIGDAAVPALARECDEAPADPIAGRRVAEVDGETRASGDRRRDRHASNRRFDDVLDVAHRETVARDGLSVRDDIDARARLPLGEAAGARHLAQQPSSDTLTRSISFRSSPKTLMPTGVRTPVVSMSMRVRIGGAMAIW